MAEAKYYGKAEAAANAIVAAFQTGNVPAALAQVFIQRKDDTPCRAWSWSNQLLAALSGTADARGFRQWQAVGRSVKKGSKAFHILAPCTKKIDAKEEGEDPRYVCYGFKAIPVFRVEDTEGDELPPTDPAVAEWINSLPLVEVARAWGLSVEAYNTRHNGQRRAGPLGMYRHGQSIALGVKNLSTWAHELLHAADDRLGNLTEAGQHWRSETVAELGGAILLEILGFERDSDRGGCWEYVEAYAKAAGVEPITACQRVLKRTCDAVALVLETAEQLIDQEAAELAVA